MNRSAIKRCLIGFQRDTLQHGRARVIQRITTDSEAVHRATSYGAGNTVSDEHLTHCQGAVVVNRPAMVVRRNEDGLFVTANTYRHPDDAYGCANDVKDAVGPPAINDDIAGITGSILMKMSRPEMTS